MHKEVYRILSFLVIVSMLGGCAGKQSSEQISETRLLLDTYCTITVHGPAEPGLFDEAFSLVEKYEALFSITIEGSDVWRINNAKGKTVPVDPETVELVKSGLEFGELSGGMFDITIGRLSRLWDFGDKPDQPSVPGEAELTEARLTIDYRQVNVNTAESTVQLVDPDAWIDLGAIAKGYIGDKIAGFLIESGVTGALIDLGGDVVAVGSRQDGTPWRIGLREPSSGNNGSGLLGVVEIAGASVIGSGTYERQFEINGVSYHHILDPKTAMPVISDVISATVVTKNALTGEGLSTIAILLGSEKAQEIFCQVTDFIGAVLVLDSGEILRFGSIELTDAR